MLTSERIAQRFDLERLAGVGGMGEVYEAHDRVTGARVALKIIRGSSTELTRRFVREGRVLATLRHPSIVQYIAHGDTTGGEPYLAMEWLDGHDLGKRLRGGPLSIADTIVLGERIATALSVAHARGVVHRDLKPTNIFLPGARLEDAKLLDFGLAHLAEASIVMTRTGTTVGTPAYMSPEQARGDREIDARTDVFSLGSVLFHCLIGESPFQGERLAAMLMKVLHEEPPRVRSLRPEVPDALDALVARMLAKDPAARPSSGAEVARELATIAPVPAERAPHAVSALTRDEQRVVCFVVAEGCDVDAVDESGARQMSETTRQSLQRIASAHGGELQVALNGTVLVMFSGSGAAGDLALMATRCALALRSIYTRASIAIAMGRSGPAGQVRTGEVIERVTHLANASSTDASSAGPSSGVRIDDVVAGLLARRFEIATERGGGMVLYAVREREDEPRTVLGKPTPFVGRERELATLMAIAAECFEEPVARVALVTGPIGAGKSRLRHELLRALEARGAEVWIGRGCPLAAGAPFGMVARAIASAAGVADDDALDERRSKLLARVGRHAKPEDVAHVAAFLGEIAATPFEDASSAALRAARSDAALMGEQVRRAFCDFLDVESAHGPLILVFDDMQWGDLPSVRLVDAAALRCADRPLLVLALGRPAVHELFPGLWGDRGVQEIHLAPITRKASMRLARSILGDAPSDAVLAPLVDRASGNPYFLEELLRAHAEGLEGSLPDTVLAMVQTRLDRLDPEARRVLRAASVFARRFTEDGVRALLGRAERTAASRWLGELVDAELLVRCDESYEFRDTLVRDAAYEMLTVADRTLGHRLAGEWLEQLGTTDPVMLAGHFERGGLLERAATWFARAAEAALEGGDWKTTLSLVRRGTTCGATGETLGALRLAAMAAHVWRNEPGLAMAEGRGVLDLLPQGSMRWCKAASFFAVQAGLRGDLDELASVAKTIEGVTPEPSATTAYVMAAQGAIICLCRFGLYEAAAPLLAGMERVGGRDEPYAAGLADVTLAAHAQYELADPWAHFRFASAAVASFERAGDRNRLEQARVEVGSARVALGDFETARSEMESLARNADLRGSTVLAMMAKPVLARALAATGAADEARAIAAEAVTALTASGNRMHEGFARSALARASLAAGDANCAERDARAAEQSPSIAVRLEALAVIAASQLARGLDAVPAARDAMKLLEAHGAAGYGEALTRLTFADALAVSGDEDGARAAIATARTRLLARAARIGDEVVRKRFLEGVAENAATLARAAAWGA